MREAASRGFWMTTYALYGYKRVHVQDGAAKRPKLELNPQRNLLEFIIENRDATTLKRSRHAFDVPTLFSSKR